MQSVLDLIESGDLFSLIVLVLILYGIGARMIERQPELRQWGMRFAVAALLGYCIYAGSDLGTSEPGLLLGVVFRGLIAAGLTLGTSWILLSIYGYMKQASDRASIKAQAKAQFRRSERERRKADQELKLRQHEWELGEPERERQEQLEEASQMEREKKQKSAQQQRDDIRYSSELFFNRHAPTIADRFTRRDLKLFFKQYMNDEQPPEVVQRRANQLMETIRQHADAVNPPEKMTTLEDLAKWYGVQKGQIENLNVSGMIRDEYLLRLKERYAELSDQLMESLEP